MAKRQRTLWPCGYPGDATHECTCSRGMVENCQKRVSGPMMDRIDIHVSARAYHRGLKPGRTIAGLAGNARIEAAHLAEAL